jgi:ATP/maltotriose-dependent transcriptional regulator MalT
MLKGSGRGGLVGRQAELGVIDRELDHLKDGSAEVMEIVGEAGIGKTRLLAEVLKLAEQRDYLVLVGHGSEFERDLPFGVFVDALDDYLAGLEPSAFQGLGPDRIDELAVVFPSLAALSGRRPAGLQEERYRSYRAVGALLKELSRQRPLLLALDDVHWADTASIELISHLLRHQPHGPVLLVLAFRPRQLAPQLASALGARAREAGSEQIALAPLSRAEAEQLLGDVTDQAVRDELYSLGGGNPFYLEQLARAPRRAGNDAPAESAGVGQGDLPAAVAAAISGEIAALPERTRKVLQAAAVAGDFFEPDLVAETTPVSEAEALEAIDDLLDIDLVRTTAVPRRFRFRHPIVRRAVYESAKSGWCIAAHQRAAAALSSRGASPADLAHHVERSAQVGDQAAIDLLTEAGQSTASRAPSAAADWFAAALRLLPQRPDTIELRLELLVAMATALGSAGRLKESRAALLELLELLPPEIGPLRVQVVSFAALVDLLLSDHATGVRRLRDAIGQLTDDRSAESAELNAQLAAMMLYELDFEKMRDHSRFALDIRGPDRALNVNAAGMLANAHHCLGDVVSARQSLDEAAHMLDELTDEELATRIEGANWIAWSEIFMERFDDGVRHMRRAIEVSRATGQRQFISQLFLGIAVAYVWQGKLSEVPDLTDAAIESARLSGSDQYLVFALQVRCWAEVTLGDVAAAVRFGQEATATAARTTSRVSGLSTYFLAEAYLEAGDAERCRALLTGPAEGDSFLVFPRYESRWLEVLARAELALGRLDQAERWTQQSEHAAELYGFRGPRVSARRARAILLMARGDPRAAAEQASTGAAEADSIGAQVEAGRMRTIAGTALAAAGDREAALAELERAQSDLFSCGALLFSDQASRELRRLGRRVRPAVRLSGDQMQGGIPSLTPRQSEVAELVAAGKTNREIAAALVLTEKGVESHLSRIFTKLGVSSRSALAIMVERSRGASA